MVKQISVPRGTADILPADIVRWQDIERKAHYILNLYGYREIRTPIFEDTELFARSAGQTSDIVQKQMLNLAAQTQDSSSPVTLSGLSLRPEGTAAIVRSYIQNNLDKIESLSKLFYFGPMFRGERPQKGRLRQFHQIGAEAIGSASASPYLDAELILLSVNILRAAGIFQFTLKMNSLGKKEDKEKLAEIIHDSLKPNIQNLCQDCQDRINRNVFRILDCKNKTCIGLVDQLNIDHQDYLSSQSQQYFADVIAALKSLGLEKEIEQSPKLVRGLDYYTDTVFEITSQNLGSQDALGAGGRYNNLVSQLGGSEGVEAVGFALGVERILLALDKESLPISKGVDLYIIVLEESLLPSAFEYLNRLRQVVQNFDKPQEGFIFDMGYRAASMRSQMRQANKLGTRYVIILGEEEAKKGNVKLKDMKTGEEKDIQRESTSEIIRIISEQRKAESKIC